MTCFTPGWSASGGGHEDGGTFVCFVDAGLELEKHGFTNVSNVLEGYEGDLDKAHHPGTLGWLAHAWAALAPDLTETR